MTRRYCALALLLVLATAAPALAQPAPAPPLPDGERAPHFDALPPELTWDGASTGLMLSADHEWATPFEVNGGVDSPSYDETMAWLDRLVAASPKLRTVSLGKSPEGREIRMVIASAEGASTPGELAANGKPTVFAQAGIHSGEIDGKDAGMMLLRDLTVLGKRSELLERANLLFVPIFSVDAHERRSPYGRINQRGPAHPGWRTNARNLNLNRDYAKADTVEMRHILAALDTWDPDLYLDLHVTDGADYQYDITFGWNRPPAAWSPAIGAWLDAVYRPAISEALSDQGHIPGRLIFTVDDLDWKQGIARFTAGPRFSNGYGDARHLPTVLVENHSLKPYRQRVLGTYVLVAESLRLLGEKGPELGKAMAEDRGRRPAELPMGFQMAPPGGERQLPQIEFLGVGQRAEESSVSGGMKPIWTGEPETATVPEYEPSLPGETIARPAAYWIAPSWADVIERLRAHGIEMETLAAPREVTVEMYRLGDATTADMPFEGRVRSTATTSAETRAELWPAGSVRVPTDQPLGDLAMLLLEPASADSFFQWGFFHEVMSRTEYVESYVMEPLAERMLAEDPALRAEYEAALEADEELRGDPRARLQWLYQRSPYWDDRYLLYPVGREIAGD
jgi:hypothetical protein